MPKRTFRPTSQILPNTGMPPILAISIAWIFIGPLETLQTDDQLWNSVLICNLCICTNEKGVWDHHEKPVKYHLVVHLDKCPHSTIIKMAIRAALFSIPIVANIFNWPTELPIEDEHPCAFNMRVIYKTCFSHKKLKSEGNERRSHHAVLGCTRRMQKKGTNVHTSLQTPKFLSQLGLEGQHLQL